MTLEFIMAPAIVGTITYGIYKLFELFVCRRERLNIIDKMGDKLSPNMLEHKISFASIGNVSSSALKFGCMFVGIGLGLLIGYLICATTIEGYFNFEDKSREFRELIALIYGACVLLFGGVGLITAFLIELKLNKHQS